MTDNTTEQEPTIDKYVFEDREPLKDREELEDEIADAAWNRERDDSE